MHLGFTGTREGMSEKQIKQLREGLLRYRDWQWLPSGVVIHHGCCAGADQQFHMIVRTMLPKAQIIGHPGDSSQHRWAEKFCDLVVDVPATANPYLTRNHEIVNAATLIFAAPSRPEAQQPRSGTWATVRYSKKALRALTVLDR